MVAPPPHGTEAIIIKRKAELRALLRRKRAVLDPEDARRRSRAAAERLWEVIGPAEGPVSVFWPLRREIDTLPVIEKLLDRDSRVLLPRQAGPGLPLVLHVWRRGEPLLEGGFGVLEPLESAPVEEPRVVVVPLLGFDEEGRRLGYGGGFYDRTLERLRDMGLRPVVVGYAFELQAVPEVPVDDHDQRLDYLVTESAVRRFAPTPTLSRD
ncbi:5-formyltetrahydrofolate cyclo-ligase [Marinimicrococcus flavescens]|uniref:5-formyltetrahydrofolate cyclo-ligase n=1 Tax=Marinimicrococcus flavescens TaxID=3031815 RepID=A0AAP3XRM0_9PROT|nr:5-formyltetrahydrofolate cyclo-ligase [Marinimicrococcus flavescens]